MPDNLATIAHYSWKIIQRVSKCAPICQTTNTCYLHKHTQYTYINTVESYLSDKQNANVLFSNNAMESVADGKLGTFWVKCVQLQTIDGNFEL